MRSTGFSPPSSRFALRLSVLKLLVILLPAIAAVPAEAQWRHLKSQSTVRRSFRSTVEDARQSTVRVLSDGKRLALGAVIDKAGLVVTKSSELKGDLVCQLPDYRRYDAKIIARDATHDLALLQLKGNLPKDIVPVNWRKEDSPSVGSWLATVDLGLDPLAIGIVSVAPRKIKHERGFLGVSLGQTDDGPRINEVIENGAAETAGLAVGDVVTHINGQPVRLRYEMVRRIQRMRPGDEIKLRVSRAQESLEMTAVLGTPELSGARASRFSRMNSLGGELSARRADFPLALQHDTILRPNQCGGPLVDIEGQVAGINIARAGRTNSFALPARVVIDLIATWKAKPEHKTLFHDDDAKKEYSAAAQTNGAGE